MIAVFRCWGSGVQPWWGCTDPPSLYGCPFAVSPSACKALGYSCFLKGKLPPMLLLRPPLLSRTPTPRLLPVETARDGLKLSRCLLPPCLAGPSSPFQNIGSKRSPGPKTGPCLVCPGMGPPPLLPYPVLLMMLCCLREAQGIFS